MKVSTLFGFSTAKRSCATVIEPRKSRAGTSWISKRLDHSSPRSSIRRRSKRRIYIAGLACARATLQRRMLIFLPSIRTGGWAGSEKDGIGILGLTHTPSCLAMESSTVLLVGASIRLVAHLRLLTSADASTHTVSMNVIALLDRNITMGSRPTTAAASTMALATGEASLLVHRVAAVCAVAVGFMERVDFTAEGEAFTGAVEGTTSRAAWVELYGDKNEGPDLGNHPLGEISG